MPDLELSCVRCGAKFVFTEKEQKIFYQRNLYHPPYCQKCRSKKVAKSAEAPKKYEIICDHCGKHDTVPFQPKVGREVLCRYCHNAVRARPRFLARRHKS